MKNSRYLIGVMFLLLQVSLIVYARFTPVRFFCWAPFDQQTNYEISVTLDDEELMPDAILQRYQIHAQGWNQHAAHNVISCLRQYESTYGKHDDATVTLRYQVNGRDEEVWHWPEN